MKKQIEVAIKIKAIDHATRNLRKVKRSFQWLRFRLWLSKIKQSIERFIKRAITYRPWKGFSLMGICIVVPLAVGVPRYWASWVLVAGFVLAYIWSVYIPGYSNDNIMDDEDGNDTKEN
jgi:hypothetical protein